MTAGRENPHEPPDYDPACIDCGHEASRHGPEADGCIECRCRNGAGRETPRSTTEESTVDIEVEPYTITPHPPLVEKAATMCPTCGGFRNDEAEWRRCYCDQQPEPSADYQQGREDGIRQAVAWLQADYQYGDMPDWRQQGVEWIEDCARDERVSRQVPDA